MGARVEICTATRLQSSTMVAPPVGARVEMEDDEDIPETYACRPSRGGASRNFQCDIAVPDIAPVAPPVGARVEIN